MTTGPDAATAHAWTALGGADALLERVSFHGPPGLPDARLPVRELARATVAVCSLAAAELVAARGGRAVPGVRIDEGAVATAFVSERHLRIDGRPAGTFAPLSGFWESADGWVRTHANYPHHRVRLLAALGLPDGEDEQAVRRLAATLRELPGEQIQERAYAAGGLAVAVAPPAGPTGLPPVRRARLGEAEPRPLPAAALPCEGVRVLDLTRVIAGPVATRTLALLGADVLRIDPPRLPESPDAHADTGFGKRSTRLDLASAADRAVFEDLLAAADVVVTGYRPGALDRLGLAPEALLERRPGLVVGQLDAWGPSGPWAGRRGFDSLVQAGVGVAALEAGPDGRPGVLPAQALDHGTGYLLAAAVLRALTERAGTGGGHRLNLSLAATADWLLHGVHPAAEAAEDTSAARAAGVGDPADRLAERDSPVGRLRYALSPVGYEGAPADWSRPPGRWGTDAPVWS
ncbi:CoA transferase [Kitasatospora sp. NBC_00240]|uniref:CoA transferase n=1 Tax=Kitasatospora sp. NBC_00240 TaxID=2903567 RepID=UPI002254C773|nr:CoA transferase [Kitasatospora sp. NBC_00240]MCX5209844.1 CoA transferase [Kitasatospora sp. NBC_00240]